METTYCAAGWAYSGEHGPGHWAESTPTCKGNRQSPIDISTSAAQFDSSLADFRTTHFDTTDGISWVLINNGHAAQVSYSYADESKEVRVSGGGLGAEYTVAQFHFHWGHEDGDGSEHLVDGHVYPMELHIVTYNKHYSGLGEAVGHSDGLAVLGFFFEVVENDNPRIAELVAHFDEIHEPNSQTVVTPFNLEDLVADMHEYYRYLGGLTTPPCSEVVTWTLFKDKIPISERQLEAFRHLQDAHHHDLVDNFRPPQDLSGRSITKSFH